MEGIKYTKERLEYLSITASIQHDDGYAPSLIIESVDGRYFMRHSINLNIDEAIDRVLMQIRKEKLDKLNEI